MQTDTKHEHRYGRVLLKLSGESFKGDKEFGIQQSVLDYLVAEIKPIYEMGIQTAIVLGGGNIVRGEDYAGQGLGRETIDYAGMLSTMINGIFMLNTISMNGMDARSLSTINVPAVAEQFVPRRAIRHLEKGRIILFVGGTGLPLMSTDTAAVLRAVEIKADAILLAKYGVDGVYDSDPNENKDARKYESLKYQDILSSNLRIMDGTAASLCIENRMNAVVFDIFTPGNLLKLMQGNHVGTSIEA